MLFQENNKAIYLQIADTICDGILSGAYPTESRIPSVREYAAEVEVNANTVMRSYDYLSSLGIIFNKRGIGYFIAPDAAETVRGMRRRELLDTEMPSFFRKLRLLGITADELSETYTKFCNNPSD